MEGEIFVNVQGDEPLIRADVIERAVELVSSGRFGIGTAMTPLRDPRALSERSIVKVLVDRDDRAIYFSRLAIPYSRVEPAAGSPMICRQHVGLYVFSREALMKFRSLPPTALERAESLEQLRALEAGMAIGVAEVDFESIGVDTPEDLARVRERLV
jgi:3-deoxy-manno-octulosonate cytidylyltransferase (CMP-KDO synthetase)